MLATTVTPFTEKVGVPLLVALIGVLGALAAAAAAYALSRVSDASARRRDGYAEATKELLSWAEYPYRIKRRTDDTPSTLTLLADIGHQHQEALRYRQAWTTQRTAGWPRSSARSEQHSPPTSAPAAPPHGRAIRSRPQPA